jgi:hypothetical protein
MKLDLSKAGLKRFFLYHAEKLILGLAIALMGVFFWLGYSVKPFSEKTPSQLNTLADEAGRYIVNPSSWEEVRQHENRQGDLKIVEKIERGDRAIDITQIPFGIWSIRAKTLDLRKDPELLPPKDLVAVHFRAPMIIESPSRLADNLSRLPLASAGRPANGAGGGGAGLGGVGVGGGAAGGRGAGGRDGGLGLGDLDGGDIAGGRGSDRGGAVGGGEDPPRGSGRSDSDAPEVGVAMNGMHEKFFPGVRPGHFSMSNNLEQISIFDAVVVTGLIEVQKQFESFQSSFADSIGYFPSRDKIDYKFLQVERRRVVPNEDPQAWEDISSQIQAWKEAIPNRLIGMPRAEYRSAPEVVIEEAYDPVLTSPIPALTMVDYRAMFTHPKIGQRIFDPLPKPEKNTGPRSGDDLFAREEAKPDDQKSTEIVRAGSDLSRYFKTVESRKPKKEYKLVRFFDLASKKPGETYEYRVRAWLFDPNHDPPEEETAADPGRGGGRAGGGRSGGLGGIGVDGGGMTPGGRGGGRGGDRAGAAGGTGSEEGGDGRNQGIAGGRGGAGAGRGGAGVGGGQSDPNDPDEGDENYVEIPITPQMKHPDVRARLAAARKEEDPQDKTKFRYFIEENGYAEPIEIPAVNLELRTARPTPWSETVQVTIQSQPANAIAGSIDYGARPLKIGNFDLFEAEPVAETVVSVWNRVYRTFLPAKKMAYRGELLDMNTTAHVLDPISWEVRMLENAPLVSEAVLVDMMGGLELPTPSTELMRYHVAREMLVLGPDGRFSIANDMDQRTQYRMSLFLEDESNEIGRRRRAPTPRASTAPDRPGGGRGGEAGF